MNYGSSSIVSLSLSSLGGFLSSRGLNRHFHSEYTQLYSAFLSKRDFPGGSDGKASAYNVGEPGSSPGSGRSPGEGNGNPFQYSCLENPMDGGAWQTTVHGVPKNWTQLSNFTFSLLSYLNVSPELPLVCSAYPSEYQMDINVHFSSGLL